MPSDEEFRALVERVDKLQKIIADLIDSQARSQARTREMFETHGDAIDELSNVLKDYFSRKKLGLL